MILGEATGLSGMFAAAFLAATPIPMQSELAFVALANAGWSLTALVAVASVGNVLGSCLTYAIGRSLGAAGVLRWMRLPPDSLARAESWFARWGRWSLLLSWAPGGDLLVALSGVLRLPVLVVVPLLILAKTTRYIALAWATSAAL